MTVKTEGGAPARSAARASGGGSVRAGTVERLGSLEVRWIFPGQMTAEVTRWFGRFPVGWSHARTPTCWIRCCRGCR
jgi:hypothetical protein